MAITQTFLGAGVTSYADPGNWNNGNNVVQALGPGGSGGARRTTARGGVGGGGGAYAYDADLSPTFPVATTVPAGGDAVNTAFGTYVVADHGVTGVGATPGTGGTVANCSPTVGAFAGGTASWTANASPGGGGAGAAGPHGAGVNNTTTIGSAGDGTTAPNPTASVAAAAAGRVGTQWDSVHGSGSGAGGGASGGGLTGGAYGGGGSGAQASNTGTGGVGGAGLIAITREGAATRNYVPNSSFYDAGVGSWPTGVSAAYSGTGVTADVTAVGTDSNGFPNLTIRIHGGGGTGTLTVIYFSPVYGIPVYPSVPYVTSNYWRLAGGDMTNIPSYGLQCDLYDAAHAYTGTIQAQPAAPTGTIARCSATAVSPATSASSSFRFFFSYTAGAAIEVTLEFSAPQYELGDTASAVLLTPGWSAWAAAAGAGAVVGDATVTGGVTSWTATAAIIGAGAILSSALEWELGSVSQGGVGSLAGAGTLIDRQARDTISSTGTVASDGRSYRPASAATSGTATAAASAVLVDRQAKDTITIAGTIAADGRGAISASATEAGVGTITLSAIEYAVGSLALGGAGGFSPDKTVTTGVANAASTAGAGSFSPDGRAYLVASASLGGVGSLSASALEIEQATGSLVGAATVYGDAIKAGVQSWSGESTITIAGSLSGSALLVDTQARDTVGGIATVTADGRRYTMGATTDTGTGTVSAAATLIDRQSTSSLSGTATVSSSAVTFDVASVALGGAAAVSSSAIEVAQGAATLGGAVTVYGDAQLAGTQTGSATLGGAGGVVTGAFTLRIADAATLAGVGATTTGSMKIRAASALRASGQGTVSSGAVMSAVANVTIFALLNHGELTSEFSDEFIINGAATVYGDAQLSGIQTGSATLAGTGSIVPGAMTVRVASALAESGAGAVATGAMTVRVASALAQAGAASFGATARLSELASGTLGGAATVYGDAQQAGVQYGSGTLPGAGSVTTGAFTLRVASAATIAGSGVNTTAPLTVVAATAIQPSGVGSVSASAIEIERASLSTIGSGTIAADATLAGVQYGSGEIDGIGTVTTVAGKVIAKLQGTAEADGLGSVTTGSMKIIAASAISPVGAGSIGATGIGRLVGRANTVGVGTVFGDPQLAGAFYGSAGLAVAGSLSVGSNIIGAAKSGVSGTAGVSSAAAANFVSRGTLGGIGALTGSAFPAQFGDTTVAGVAVLTSLGVANLASMAQVDGGANLDATGAGYPIGDASIAAGAGVEAIAVLGAAGTSLFIGSGAVVASTRYQPSSDRSEMGAVGNLSAIAIIVPPSLRGLPGEAVADPYAAEGLATARDAEGLAQGRADGTIRSLSGPVRHDRAMVRGTVGHS